MNSICVCQNNIICPDCLNNPEYMINVYNDKMNNYITEIPNSHYSYNTIIMGSMGNATIHVSRL